jgi:hypothetical protein
MVTETTFLSTEAMEQLVATGMEESLAAATGQMDDVLLVDTATL